MKNIGTNAQAITPSDTANFTKTGCIYVGTAGNVNVLPLDKANSNTPADGVIFYNVPAGTILPVVVKKVFAGTGGTATTASNLTLITEM